MEDLSHRPSWGLSILCLANHPQERNPSCSIDSVLPRGKETSQVLPQGGKPRCEVAAPSPRAALQCGQMKFALLTSGAASAGAESKHDTTASVNLMSQSSRKHFASQGLAPLSGYTDASSAAHVPATRRRFASYPVDALEVCIAFRLPVPYFKHS